MEPAYTVALVGFTQSESATFESFFRLAARRLPAYAVQEEVLDAQLLIVNTDNAQAVALVRGAGLPGRVLAIGGHDAGTGWPLARRPLRLVSLLASLDTLVGRRAGRQGEAAAVAPRFAANEAFKASQLHGLQASMRLASGKPQASHPIAPAAPARRRTPDTEFPATRPMTRDEVLAMLARAADPHPAGEAVVRVPVPTLTTALAAPPPARAPASRRDLTDFAGLEELLNLAPPARRSPASRLPSRLGRGEPTLPEAVRGEALLVGQSLVEGRILLKRLRQFGLQVDWCRDSTQAQAMLQAHAYRLVVIDRLGGQPDAFQVCRWAKQAKPAPGEPAATVILFAPSAGSMERMKAGLAGADAYLSRSVSEAELYKVLAQHRLVSPRGFAPTDIAGF